MRTAPSNEPAYDFVSYLTALGQDDPSRPVLNVGKASACRAMEIGLTEERLSAASPGDTCHASEIGARLAELFRPD